MMSACHKLQHHEAEGFIRAHDRPRGNARGWRPRSEWGDNRARCAPIAERSEFQPDDPEFRLDQTRLMVTGGRVTVVAALGATQTVAWASRYAGYRFILEMPAMAVGARERAGEAQAALGWRWRNPRRPSMGFAPKIRFAPDSPLEGDGFEPSVPRCDRASANS